MEGTILGIHVSRVGRRFWQEARPYEASAVIEHALQAFVARWVVAGLIRHQSTAHFGHTVNINGSV
jgi:hypothetical protein